MLDTKDKIVELFKESKQRRKSKNNASSMNIVGDGNIQAGGDIIIKNQKQRRIKILPPQNSIGNDPLLKQTIIEKFNRLANARSTRFSKTTFPVMYSKFKKDFGIKNAPWTIIWTWDINCAGDIINYLDEKYNNTVQGRMDRAAARPGFIHTTPHLFRMEKELLSKLGIDIKGEHVKELLRKHFGVDSHTKLTPLQHWQWVRYLEGVLKNYSS